MDEVALMEQISEGYAFYFLFDTKRAKKSSTMPGAGRQQVSRK